MDSGDAKGELVRLRDLPGVQRVAELCRNPRNFDYPTSSYTREQIDDVSISLFCITEWTTFLHEDDELEDMTPAEYEEKFLATGLAWPESRPFWEAIGWDISDGEGNEYIAAHFFARQIIAVEGELVEGARLSLEGRGEWPFDDEGYPIDADEQWARALERQAERFMEAKRSG